MSLEPLGYHVTFKGKAVFQIANLFEQWAYDSNLFKYFRLKFKQD